MLQLDKREDSEADEQNSFFFEHDQNPKVSIAVNIFDSDSNNNSQILSSSSDQKS